MAKHNIFLTLPEHEVGNVDVDFSIFQNDEKLGRITVSKGGMDYYPNRKKIPIKITWSQFDTLLKSFKDGS
jgi:hypothetical protein